MTKINYSISRFDYKKEIDVLRFISVLSVILFHLDVEYFKGGFSNCYGFSWQGKKTEKYSG